MEGRTACNTSSENNSLGENKLASSLMSLSVLLTPRSPSIDIFNPFTNWHRSGLDNQSLALPV